MDSTNSLFSVLYRQHPYSFELSEHRRVIYYSESSRLPKKSLKIWEADGCLHKVYPVIKDGKKLAIPFPTDKLGNRFIKNSKAAGTPRMWTINGQALYNGTMYPQVRAKITSIAHKYLKRIFEGESAETLKNIKLALFNHKPLILTCEIYELRRSKMPDISNMWVWNKWFEDTLQELGLLENDNPNFIIENRTRYVMIEKELDRKLLFYIHCGKNK